MLIQNCGVVLTCLAENAMALRRWERCFCQRGATWNHGGSSGRWLSPYSNHSSAEA